MRLSSTALRTLVKTSRLLALAVFLLSPAPGADAAPRPIVRSRAPVCDPHTATLKSMRRQAASLGPVAKRAKPSKTGLLDTTPRMRRGGHSTLADDDAAIQNDAPAAQIDGGDDPAPALRALGLLASSFDRIPSDSPFSPRSPRGPPSVL